MLCTNFSKCLCVFAFISFCHGSEHFGQAVLLQWQWKLSNCAKKKKNGKYNWFSVSIFLRPRQEKRERKYFCKLSILTLLSFMFFFNVICSMWETERKKKERITEIAIIMVLKFPKNWNNSFFARYVKRENKNFFFLSKLKIWLKKETFHY